MQGVYSESSQNNTGTRIHQVNLNSAHEQDHFVGFLGIADNSEADKTAMAMALYYATVRQSSDGASVCSLGTGTLSLHNVASRPPLALSPSPAKVRCISQDEDGRRVDASDNRTRGSSGALLDLLRARASRGRSKLLRQRGGKRLS